MKRVILIVLDSFGIGALPDAELYDDKFADTFGHIFDHVPDFDLPNLRRLGLGNITNAAYGKMKVEKPIGAYCRAAESSLGKDTTTGHWEIAGIITDVPFKTYPDGFPKKFMEKFEEAIGRGILGNKVASGTEIIEELGEEHERTGKPIIYTSADSVFQVAANTSVIPLEELYKICQTAREMLVGEFACARVIARPYVMNKGKRERTADRHDYAVSPPQKTILDAIIASGQKVMSVGKIKDIYNGVGISEGVKTTSNMDGVDKTLETMSKKFDGLLFTNLVDFDSKYGHRRNPEGYARALMDFDERLPEILAKLNDDLLIICADHGNDPVHSGFNHTREYVPVLAYANWIKAGQIDDRTSFADIGATVCDYLGVAWDGAGVSFLEEIE